MIEPRGAGVVAFLAKRISGVLHVLVHARVGPGYLDVVELAPTVQCAPSNYVRIPRPAHLRYLDEVLNAAPSQQSLFPPSNRSFEMSRSRLAGSLARKCLRKSAVALSGVGSISMRWRIG